MTGYVRPISVEPGMFPIERCAIIRTADGPRAHLVDVTSLESGLLLVSIVRGLNDQWLVRFPYCCDPLTCWIPAEDLLLPSA